MIHLSIIIEQVVGCEVIVHSYCMILMFSFNWHCIVYKQYLSQVCRYGSIVQRVTGIHYLLHISCQWRFVTVMYVYTYLLHFDHCHHLLHLCHHHHHDLQSSLSLVIIPPVDCLITCTPCGSLVLTNIYLLCQDQAQYLATSNRFIQPIHICLLAFADYKVL